MLWHVRSGLAWYVKGPATTDTPAVAVLRGSAPGAASNDPTQVEVNPERLTTWRLS